MKWNNIKGYEGYYEVSDTGLVRSVSRVVSDKKTGHKTLIGKQMKISESKNKKRDKVGYYVVNLHREHKSKVSAVHRIVAEAFLDNDKNLPTVNHKDGNKHNNNVWNLEWASYSYNNFHAIKTNLRHPRGSSVIQLSKDEDVINIFKSSCEASRLTGISRGMISHCINRRCKYAGGYKWIKVEECNDYLNDESTTEDELRSEVQERETEDIVCANGNI